MKYPTDVVEDVLRKTTQEWLSERIREKKSGEPPGLEEVIQKNQASDELRIYRGYFKQVPQGYKRYRTAEERDNPTSDVGTIRASDIVRGPEAPTADHCVQAYNRYIEPLLSRPHDRSKWEKLVELCDELDQKLADYRQIPGHGEVDVSFKQEAEFARQLLEDQTWPKVETLLRPLAPPPKPPSQR